MFFMSWIAKGLQKCLIPPHAADIFRWTGAFAFGAIGVLYFWFRCLNLLHENLLPPTISKMYS